MKRMSTPPPPVLAFRTFARTVWAPALLFTACAASTPPATQPRAVAINAGVCEQANYPAEARQWEAAGSTEMEFEVNPEGKVTRVAILKPSGTSPGHLALDTLARNTLSKCTFPPAPGFLSGSARMVYVWKLE